MTMKARDVMVSPVITVKPNSSIREVAKKLLENRISAVPVVDDGGKLVGMISEGDLMHRSEAFVTLVGRRDARVEICHVRGDIHSKSTRVLLSTVALAERERIG
jgi:predicted transcriptional regulator